MSSLTSLGPPFLLEAKHRPKDFERDITVEMWLYPDRSRILEISTQCLPSEAFRTGVELKSDLEDKGVTLDESEETKTKTSLERVKPKPRSPQPRRKTDIEERPDLERRKLYCEAGGRMSLQPASAPFAAAPTAETDAAGFIEPPAPLRARFRPRPV